MNDQYYLPEETAQLLTSTRVQQCRNLGLLLDKYPPRTAIDESKGKSNWLKSFVLDNHIDTHLAEHVYTRWRSATVAMQAEHFTAATQWRMVVGLGGETVLETDLTLHHLYGIPLIPGSALKGLTRAYVTGEVAEHKNESKKIDEDDPVVQRIFGTQRDAGSVIFFDAMPVDGKVEIDLDIMNAHYPKYYGEKQLPTNSQDPNPVTFLTITNTKFMFALAPRRPKDIDDVKLAVEWLQAALQKYGVGGKTSAGYGYFQPPDNQGSPLSRASSAESNISTSTPGAKSSSPQSELVDPEVRKAHGYLREIAALTNVAGQIHGYYQQWQIMKSEEARLLLAKAILEKVRQAGREKASAEKAWYKELLAFIDQTKAKEQST